MLLFPTWILPISTDLYRQPVQGKTLPPEQAETPVALFIVLCLIVPWHRTLSPFLGDYCEDDTCSLLFLKR